MSNSRLKGKSGSGLDFKLRFRSARYSRRATSRRSTRMANKLPPKIEDPAERSRILRMVGQNMRNNPLPANAPRFTRDELHERS
jgi:hypothetical protein